MGNSKSACVGNTNDSRCFVKRAFNKITELVKKLKLTFLDKLGGDHGVEVSSVASSCSIASMYLPPNMSPDLISDVELFSSKTASWDVCSVGDSGGEEFKHPAPGRTTRYHGCLSRSLSFPYNINRDPFGEKPGSDQWVFPEQMSSVLYPERWHSMSSLRIGIEVQGV